MKSVQYSWRSSLPKLEENRKSPKIHEFLSKCLWKSTKMCPKCKKKSVHHFSDSSQRSPNLIFGQQRLETRWHSQNSKILEILCFLLFFQHIFYWKMQKITNFIDMLVIFSTCPDTKFHQKIWKNYHFLNFLNFGYAILFQVPAVQKWGSGTFGNNVKSGAHFFFTCFLSKTVIYWPICCMSSHRVQAKNMKISKNPNIFEFWPFIHVRRLCSPKIKFLVCREPFEHWCTKCEFSYFSRILDTFWWFFMNILTEFHVFLKIFRFLSNFGRLDLHDYWPDFEKFGHF